MPKRKKERWFQGKFTPKHPEKYIGDLANIVFRSGYEFNFLKKLDDNPNVLKYTSETVIIRYYNPVKMRWARYFVDFLLEVKDKEGKIFKYLIEIKPANQIHPPKQGKAKKMQTFLGEAMEFSQNQAKWKAAKAWSDQHGILFLIVTVNEKTKKFEYIDSASLIMEEKIPKIKA